MYFLIFHFILLHGVRSEQSVPLYICIRCVRRTRPRHVFRPKFFVAAFLDSLTNCQHAQHISPGGGSGRGRIRVISTFTGPYSFDRNGRLKRKQYTDYTYLRRVMKTFFLTLPRFCMY